MASYTIRPILTGYQQLDKGLYATYGHGYGETIEVPVFCFLVEGEGRKILVDTGMSDTERSITHHHPGRQEPGQAVHEQLTALGVRPEEIGTIVFTHLHWDHCYNVKEFPGARLVVSRKEYEFALDPIPFYWSSYEHANAGLTPPFDGCEFELVEGEATIVDGIEVFPTPGHSPGHQSVSIQTEAGKYVIVGDLFFLRENLEADEEHGWPLTPPGRFANVIELWPSMVRAVERADFILMTHDPEQIGVDIYPQESD